MFSNPSLMTRIAIGKGIGFIVGLVAFFSLPFFLPDANGLFRWGILFWLTTVGAFIGVFGVFTWHPILRLPMPWWFRSALIGSWMSFVLTFFAYDEMKAIMVLTFGPDGVLSSPFWSVIDGAIFGMIIGYFATRFGGEGKETVEEQP
jgi:hypothetical protein